MLKKLFSAFVAVDSSANPIVEQAYSIDPAHSQIHFTVPHLVAFKVRGNFTDFTGSLVADADAKQLVAAEATIQAASVDTRVDQRDEHLRSADFFEVEKFPELSFKSKKVSGSADNISVVGDLTIKGVTKEVILKGSFSGTAVDPWGNKRVGFEARGEVDRKEFGLVYNQVLETGGVLIGDKVILALEVEAIAQ